MQPVDARPRGHRVHPRLLARHAQCRRAQRQHPAAQEDDDAAMCQQGRTKQTPKPAFNPDDCLKYHTELLSTDDTLEKLQGNFKQGYTALAQYKPQQTKLTDIYNIRKEELTEGNK